MKIGKELLAAIVLAVAVAAFTPTLAFAYVTPWDINICAQANMQDPHISQGWGVLAKSQWQCNDVPSTVHQSYLEGGTGYWLWVCPNYPQSNETYLNSNCTFKGATYGNIGFSTAGQVQTRYVPSNGQVTHGTGYWIACTQWYSTGPHGTGQTFLIFSNVVWLSY